MNRRRSDEVTASGYLFLSEKVQSRDGRQRHASNWGNILNTVDPFRTCSCWKFVLKLKAFSRRGRISFPLHFIGSFPSPSLPMVNGASREACERNFLFLRVFVEKRGRRHGKGNNSNCHTGISHPIFKSERLQGFILEWISSLFLAGKLGDSSRFVQQREKNHVRMTSKG